MSFLGIVIFLVVMVIVMCVVVAQAFDGPGPGPPGRKHELPPSIEFVGKGFEVMNAIGEAKKDVPKLLNAYDELEKNLAKCEGNNDDPNFNRWYCNVQAIGDTWEATQKDHETVMKNATRLGRAITDIVTYVTDDKKAYSNGALHPASP